MRLVAHIVTRNEAGRYLETCIAQLRGFDIDAIAVYDDRSEDETALIARDAGAIVGVRPLDAFSFAEHEGAFRAAAWDWMIRATDPDWVLSIDADELLESAWGPGVIKEAAAGPVKRTLIYEVFDLTDEGKPLVRVDGHWGRISGVRLVPASPIAYFRDKTIGCGSVPEHHLDAKALHETWAIAHLGYVTSADRIAKHDRYLAAATGTRGHSPAHIRSILERPTLTERDLQPWPADRLTR